MYSNDFDRATPSDHQEAKTKYPQPPVRSCRAWLWGHPGLSVSLDLGTMEREYVISYECDIPADAIRTAGSPFTYLAYSLDLISSWTSNPPWKNSELAIR